MTLRTRLVALSVALALFVGNRAAHSSSLPDPSPPPTHTAPSWNLPPPPKVVPPPEPAPQPPRHRAPSHRRPQPPAKAEPPAAEPAPAPGPEAKPEAPAAPPAFEPDDAGRGGDVAPGGPPARPAADEPQKSATEPSPAPVAPAAPPAPAPAPTPVPALPPPAAQSPTSGPLAQPHAPTDRLLARWYESVGHARGEPFGRTLMRAARVMVGRPYVATVVPAGEELLDLNIRGFECVTFVESSLALARCVALETPTDDCFAQQVTQLRYRDGKIDGFASRLNYFEEWLADNERRGHIQGITKELGGAPVLRRTAYMTRHPQAYPPLSDRGVYRQISAIEARLSRTPTLVIDANNIHAIEDKLENGDIVAIATFRRDILVRHVGFVERDAKGGVHLMHASERRHKVVVTRESLADFVDHLPRHEGVLLARPVRPERPLAAD